VESQCTVEHVGTTLQLDRLRLLFLEFQKAVGAPECFEAFDDELATLPGEYGEPRGCLLLATSEGNDVGCVGLRPGLTGTPNAELKRLYVRPACRGTGVGRALVVEAIRHARRAGYQRIHLETLETMEDAQRLYRSLGFQNLCPERGPCGAHPIAMELVL